MQPYPDPLAADPVAGDPLAGDPLAADPLAAGEPVALAPLPGYLDAPASFGDALAAAAPGADPTAAPLSALGGSVFGADFGRTDDLGGTRPQRAVDRPATYELTQERRTEAPETTTMGLEIPQPARRAAPRASVPPEGGRYELGIPRGYDPPTVPANRGWAGPAAPPTPRDRRRTGGRPQARRAGLSQPTAQPPRRPTRESWPPPQPGTRRAVPQTAPRLGTPGAAKPQAVRELPQAFVELTEATVRNRRGILWTKAVFGLIFGWIALGAGLDRNWATLAIFAGLTLIVIRPRIRPRPRADRLAAAQAAAERRRRATAPTWPRR